MASEHQKASIASGFDRDDFTMGHAARDKEQHPVT
jgi:hypothetical protein